MRKGVGTILGIILFIGILFSSIVPLQIYLKENRNMLVAAEKEVIVNDGYREQEDLYVFAYPTNESSNQIMIKVENKGAIPITLRNVWIKDTCEIINTSITPGQKAELGPFLIDLHENTTYLVKIITDRGRLFSSDSGNLLFYEGTWVTIGLGINVQIANTLGKYYVKVFNETWSSNYTTQGMDQDDVLIFFEVKTNGLYYVICKKNSPTGPDLPGTPMVVELSYPSGPPVVFIYTSGYDL